MTKRNRNGERNEEGLLQNGHALKRHNEDSCTPKNQDYEHKGASAVKISTVAAKQTTQDRSPSSCLYSISNENSAKRSGQPRPGEALVSEKLNVPSLLQEAGQVSTSFTNGNMSCFISPTDVTAACQHTLQTRPGSSACQETDPSAGNDSQLILSLAAVARSACSSSVEAGLSDDDSSMPSHRDVDCQELKVGGIEFALRDLKTTVGDHGGFSTVDDSKLWPTVAREMGIDSTKCASAASSLKRIFQQRILARPIIPADSQRICSSSVDRSTLAAKLLAKRKATEALEMEAHKIKIENSEITKKVTGINDQFSLSDAMEPVSLTTEPKMPESDETEEKMGVDPDIACRVEDEEYLASGIKLKRENDGRGRQRSAQDSNMKSETDSTRGLFSSKEESRSGRESGPRSLSNLVGDQGKRKSRRDGESPGPADDIPDRKLSREDRKFRSILRQIELLEKKQRGTDQVPGPSSGDASPRRPGSWENEVELSSLTRKRKDLLKEEFREKERERERAQDREKKDKDREKDRREKELDPSSAKKRPAVQVKDGTAQPGTDLGAGASKKAKGPSKQTPAKGLKGHTRKSMKSDELIRGPLAILREFKKASRKTFPCVPRVFGKNPAAEEKPVFHSRKSRILSLVANDDDNTGHVNGSGAGGSNSEAEVFPTPDSYRLNPNRRPQDKKTFPVMKRLLSKWMQEKAITPETESRPCMIAEDASVVGEPAGSQLQGHVRGGEVHLSVIVEQKNETLVLELDENRNISSDEIPRRQLAPEHVDEHIPSDRKDFGSDIDEAADEKDSRSANDLQAVPVESESGPPRELNGTCHRDISETAYVSAQNRRPISQVSDSSVQGVTGGKVTSGSGNEYRISPPLSPVSSDGVSSRNGSPTERGAMDIRPTEASGAHRRPTSQEKPSSSPRNRSTAWDVVPSGDRSVHDSRESRDGREGRDNRESRDRDRDRDRDGRNSGILCHAASTRDTSLHRDRQRDMSPTSQSLRRRQSSPPRSLFTGELRERGLQISEGGLSRESLRRERQGLASGGSCRTIDRPGLASSGSTGRDRERFGSLNSTAEHSGRQAERPGAKLWGTDLAGRAHSPGRSLDRGERGLVLERSGGQDRGGAGGGGPVRERSLSPRSKEALREMQVARERRAKELAADAVEPGEVESPSSAAAGHQAELDLYAQVITGGRLRLRRAVVSPCQAQQRGELWEVVPIFRCEAAAAGAAAEAAVVEAVADCYGESGHRCLTIVVDDDVSCPSVPQDGIGHGALIGAAAEVVLCCGLAGLGWIEAAPATLRSATAQAPPHLSASLPAAGIPLALCAGPSGGRSMPSPFDSSA
eukprot:CAMPEP_0172189132 /NCGR_PEP_ID=MMETSP1050-20130122/22348_1 /TAXON_ID=233186 /ORGANISM="Cryptomonas curvata, Strain CCAP979/52" /LENGTH=1329 /DNA_ID=CAMNT_0012863781 /DNA_START=398 /DNA_END=4387 /DNA_ORIENTATION=+